MAILKNWSVVNRNTNPFSAPELSIPCLQGNIYNDGNGRFADGTLVSTSMINDVINRGDFKEVITRSGTIYKVFKNDVDEEYEKIFPKAYERLGNTLKEEK